VDLYAQKAKAVVIRHRGGHQVIAMVEIVSPRNKSSQTELSAFVRKADQALLAGVHLLIIDLFPPTPRDPHGIHRAIWGEGREGDFALPDDRRLTCMSYVGYPCIGAHRGGLLRLLTIIRPPRRRGECKRGGWDV
jgi:hypothetical protein